MKKRVLLVIESCNPELSSVPLVGFNFYRMALDFASVHLVTHCRNRRALQEHGFFEDITYYDESSFEIAYYKLITVLSTYRGKVIWPLRHALQFPIYFFFNRFVYNKFARRVKSEEYDVVHALTPIMPRFPYKIAKACKLGNRKTPFVLGPVNGGVPFPDAFKEVARQEFGFLNWLRSVGRWITPGYRDTYLSADVILTGSKYTDSWLKKTFKSARTRMIPMYENGVANCFYESRENGIEKVEKSTNSSTSKVGRLTLLFIGRLEPYKGCDMLLHAVRSVVEDGQVPVELVIVGDGTERARLQHFVHENGLTNQVFFRGWRAHSEIPEECAAADIFCFPSVREFGGAVVMEAMATGLPCVVVDNGGIGEYVTDSSGIKISPLGREYVIEKLRDAIISLGKDRARLNAMKKESLSRALEFSWEAKKVALKEIYNNAVKSELHAELKLADAK